MGNRQGTKISAGQVKDRRAISGPLAPVTKGLSRTFRGSPSRRSSHMTARTAQIPKLIVQLGEIGLAAEGVRVERRVASPEPAVGVFTPARTCPGRLRCHCVIGSPTLDRTRLPSAPAATGFGEGSGPGSGAVGARCRPGSGDDDWGAARPGVGHDGATRRVSRPCRLAVAWRVRTWCRAQGRRPWKGAEG